MNLRVLTSGISSTAQVAWHLIKDGLTSPDMIKKAWKKSHSTVRDAIRELLRVELIVRIGQGQYRVVDEDGRISAGWSFPPNDPVNPF